MLLDPVGVAPEDLTDATRSPGHGGPPAVTHVDDEIDRVAQQRRAGWWQASSEVEELL
jgi:hypothetical protein